jgi:hypothetical protein
VRRWIHSVIVALLCLTLFVDTAKACWFRRHRGRTQTCRPAVCPPACGQPTWQSLQPGCEGSMSEVAIADVVVHDADGEFAHDVSTNECCTPCAGSDEEFATAEPVVEGEPIVGEQSVVQPKTADVVVHGPTIVVDAAPRPTPAADQAAAEQPMTLPPLPAEPRGPQPMPAPLPELKPAPTLAPAESPAAAPMNKDVAVEPKPETDSDTEADAEKPAASSDDLAGEPAMPPAAAKPPVENLFDEFDDEEDEAVVAGDDEAAPAAEPAEDEEMAAEESADDEPAAPAEESAGDDSEEKPTTEAADGAETDEKDAAPEEEQDSAFLTPGEPMRHWTDATGEHQVMGWLVGIRGDEVRILKLNGRHTTVTLETLSAADRDYATAVADRLAAERQGVAPATHETAGL